MTRRVAVVGSGIAGLAAAYRLAPTAQVTLYEADTRFGGHAHTVDVTLDGQTAGVDIAFLSLNTRTYPQLLALFAELDVATVEAPLTFSVQVPDDNLEWTGPSLNALFAQRRNLVRPRFLRMLADVLRFNRQGTRLAQHGAEAALREPVGDFLRRHRYSQAFTDWYLLPMVGSLWNCPTSQVLQFPIATLIRYCHNHGLIDSTGRQPWHTVRGGSRTYVLRLLERLKQHGALVHAGTPVLGVQRDGTGVRVRSRLGIDHHDHVVLACHADQSLALLEDADDTERSLLGAFRFQANRAVLHTDARMMPRLRRAWGSWSYERARRQGAASGDGACVHYWLNALQPLPFTTPLLCSLNPVREPDAARVIDRFEFTHPIFDLAAIAAQRRMQELQGCRRTWFCGAWMGYGFHEDGIQAGSAVAAALAQAEIRHELSRPHHVGAV